MRERTILNYAFLLAWGLLLLLLVLLALQLKASFWVDYALLIAGIATAWITVVSLQSARHGLYSSQMNIAALSSANEQLNASNKYLQLLATTDPLTGLSNRVHLYQRLEGAIADSYRDHTCWCLLLLDLNRFKAVNDTLGHQHGDDLLQQVALRLTGALRESDTVARLGGDEFAVLLPQTDPAAGEILAQRLVQVLEVPFRVADRPVRVGASIGIANFPDHGVDVHTLMRSVDVAMYQAKRDQSGYALYNPASDLYSTQSTPTDELRQALSGGQLEMYYQPQVHLATNRVTGVEALVRWRHPERGLIGPDSFIPLAERSGLIGPLTNWVLEATIRQAYIWQQQNVSLNVAVNLSIQNLENAQLPAQVHALLRRYAVDPRTLTVEITESVLMSDPGPVLEVLKQLAEAGLRIAIDDFGTGYSTLGYLRQLPVNEVKIDKVFVLGLSAQQSAGAAKDRMIVRAVTALAHALGLEVVAEGVENQAVCDVLAGLRCNVVQGFHIAPPLPIDEFNAWLRRQGPQQELASNQSYDTSDALLSRARM